MAKTSQLVAFLSCCAGLVAQQVLVTPPGHAASPGNSGNTYPWGRGAGATHFQQVTDSTNFTAQGVTGPILITRLRFRPDDGSPTSWAGGMWPNVRIDLATSPTDYLSMSSNFANNLGPDVTTAWQGSVAVAAGDTQGTGVVRPWYIDVPLQQAFAYDPTTGNDLTLDIQFDGIGWAGTGRSNDVVSAGGGASLASRVTASNLLNPAGSLSVDIALVTEWTYQPVDDALVARFWATPTSGPAPLVVTFHDDSHSSNVGGVLAWAWDFDGDTIIDSFAQNPTHTFTSCGDFPVSLTVYDAQHAPATLTRSAFVQTDPITAAFTVGALGSSLFQFTDTSTPAATAWAWDFNGDQIIDSTAQNPIASLGSNCSSTVQLIATHNCRTSLPVQKRVLNAPHSLAVTPGGLTATSTGSPYVGNFLDLQVTAPEGILVCGLTSYTSTGTGPHAVEIHVTPTSYLNKDGFPFHWRLAGIGTGTMAGGTAIAPSANEVVLDAPVYFPQGSYGVAIYHRSTAGFGPTWLNYTNGVLGPISNGDLVLHPTPATTPGVVRTALFGSSGQGPFAWHGAFHYTKVTTNGQGGYGFLGLGCIGTAGVPRNLGLSSPRLGQPLVVKLTNLPFSAGAFWFGATRFAPPVDAGVLGAPGCPVYASPDMMALVFGTGGEASMSTFVPADPLLVGARFYAQGAGYDPTLNAFGFSASDAAGLTIGF